MTCSRNFYLVCLFLLSPLVLDYKTVAGNMADANDFFVENEDLTVVTWAHAVNSKAKLDETLKGNKMMIEADVVLGSLEGQSERAKMPVMAHPPKTTSDLSLEEFLNTISKTDMGKGIKLDFKTKEAFAASEKIIENFLQQHAGILLWLNADIIPGPVNCKTKPVDADYFLSTCVTKFPTCTISAGWATCYGNGIDTGSYTPNYIANMTDALNRNAVVQPVTFAVRAGLAAQSHQSLTNLMGSSAPGTTLTIWSSQDGDYVKLTDLLKLINDIGFNKIYLDLPEDMLEKLRAKANPSFGNILPILLTSLLSLYLM